MATRLQIRSRALRIVALSSVVGGLGGTLLDQIHVRAHVLLYIHPDLAGQPWWVAPQFGVAVFAILLASVAGTRRLGRGMRDPFPVLAAAAVFGVAYGITGVFHRQAWWVFASLLIMWIVMIAIHRDRVSLIVLSISLAALGPTYESVLTATGAFRYTVTPLVFRIPVWLPVLYLNAGILAADVAQAVTSARDGNTIRASNVGKGIWDGDHQPEAGRAR